MQSVSETKHSLRSLVSHFLLSMALESGEKPVSRFVRVRKHEDCTILFLRVITLFATVAATAAMATNKETKSLVVATIGTTPVKVTLTAKFQHTPAFVFFVVANAMASLHNLLMILVHLFGGKFKDKGLRLVMMAILDMMTVALASSGDGAATFMAQLGKNGNSHARWNKICDKFDRYCDQGGGALIASYIGLLLLLAITVLTIIKLLKAK